MNILIVANFTRDFSATDNGRFKYLANKNERLITDKDLREQMGANARRCAEEKFDRKNSYVALISEILWGGGTCHLHDYIVFIAFIYESSRMEAVA